MVDMSPYEVGIQGEDADRTARLVEEDGMLVSVSDTPVDDDVLSGLIDASRAIAEFFEATWGAGAGSGPEGRLWTRGDIYDR